MVLNNNFVAHKQTYTLLNSNTSIKRSCKTYSANSSV